MNNSELIIEHNAGFFSCCSVKLTKLADFYNKYHRPPTSICCRKQFHNYKSVPVDDEEDITPIFFKTNTDCELNNINKIDFHWEYQFIPYHTIDFEGINPLIAKYFTPSDYVSSLMDNTIQKYNIDFSSTVAVCYRGNDKCTETVLATHNDFFDRCTFILNRNKSIRFLVQTDEIGFRDKFLERFPNSFFIEEIQCFNEHAMLCPHQEVDSNKKTEFGALILHAIILLSRCEYVITHSGNCGMWISLYRGHSKKIEQYLNHGQFKCGWISM